MFANILYTYVLMYVFDMRFHTTEILLKASQQTLQACLTFFDHCCVVQTSDRMQSTDF